VLFTSEAAKACAAAGGCTAGTCELYDPRAYDFDYVVDFVPDLTDVRITVVDPQRRVRPKAFVTLLGPTTRHAHAGENGVVKFGDVAPGRYLVLAQSEGYRLGETTLDVVARGAMPQGGPSGGPSLSFLIPGGEGGDENDVIVEVQEFDVTFIVSGADPLYPGCPHGRFVEEVIIEQVSDVDENGDHPRVKTGFDGTATMHVKAGAQSFLVRRRGFVSQQVDISVGPPAPQPQTVPVTLQSDPDEKPMRDRVVAIAQHELRVWQASQAADANDPNRQAWPRLNDYFSAVIGFNQAITFPTKPAQWCGIFAVWCVRMGAHPCASWSLSGPPEHVGEQIVSSDKRFPSLLAPGDVVHIWLEWDEWFQVGLQQNARESPEEQVRKAKEFAKKMTGGQEDTTNHHGIVVAVNGSTVTTIEGNTHEPDGTGTAGQPKACAVSLGTRSTSNRFKRGWIDFFYTIKP
jgi:hypothetical protein